jgi:hypothetical protein
MNFSNKEKAYDMVMKQLALCTVEDAHHEAVVVLVDNKTGTVKVYGLNIDEFEVPELLLEAAEDVAKTINAILEKRTVQ